MPLLLCAVLTAKAQVSTANVTGVVEDVSGARISGAKIKLINSLTGTENKSQTTSSGVFALSGILPGSYTMQIEREGFATIQFSALALTVGDTKSFRVLLRLGSVKQTIDVDASGLTINTDDVSISTVVDQQFVANIPLNGRSFQDLISMTPGAIMQSPQGRTAGEFSVNGQRTDTNSYMIDGVSANIGPGPLDGSQKLPSAGQYAGTTSLGTTQGLIPLDALQEFRVLSSSYSAEYGRTPGGQFTLLTRSGTSQVHGSAYAYLRNSYFDATDWFGGFHTPNSAYHVYFYQQDLGGTLSVPLSIPFLPKARNKTFFFGSYEELHVLQPTAPLTQYIPDIQSSSSAINTLISAFPFGQKFPTGKGLLTFVSTPISLPSYVKSMDLRLDHRFAGRVSTFFRYGQTPSGSQTRQLSALSNTTLTSRTATAGIDAQLSAKANNELRLGYATSNSHLTTILDNYFAADPIDLPGTLGVPAPTSVARAEMYVRIAGIGESFIDTDNARNSLRQWNLRNTTYRQAGNHLLRFGFDQRRIHSSVSPAPLSIEADYFDLPSILNNSASNLVITQSEPASPVFNEFSVFVQDEWKISKRLTASMGLRWEIDPPPGEANGHNAYTVRGDVSAPATLTLAPRGTPLWHTDWGALGPRLGLAWSADGRQGRELVLRAGGGIFFDTANQAATGAFGALGFSATSVSTNTSIPVPPTSFDFAAGAAPGKDSIAYAFPANLKLPYTYQWNVSVEKALGQRQLATLSYVGSAGHRLLQPQRQDVGQQNTDLSEIVYFPAAITSSYQSFQAKFQRSVAPGLELLGSYVWSHTLDFGSTNPASPLTYGNSDLDVRHNFQAAVSWSQPKIGGNRIKRNALNGWGFDGRFTWRTAYPVTPLGNLFSDPVTGERFYSNVDLAPNRPLYLYGPQYAGGRIFNGGPTVTNPALQLPSATDGGDAPRNFLRGFDAQQISLAVRRDIRLYDRVTLQLRAESFNILNSPDFGYVDPHLTDALFGQPTLSLNQSFGQSGSLYQLGGPRSLQWMFRVAF